MTSPLHQEISLQGDTQLLEVLLDVAFECKHQKELKASGRFEHTPDEVVIEDSLPMLVEEVGEVARAMCDDATHEQLYDELVQVAAVAARMAQGIKRYLEGHLREGDER